MAMDKLQPIIKHHFWIVFLIALMLPPIAWWMTTGELAAEIADRTSSLDSTFSGIANGQNAANDDWANGVNQLIAIRTEANRLALDRLWKAQTDLMVWPPIVADEMKDCPYRGELEDLRIKQVLPAMYRDGYDRDVRRVWHIPEPIDDGKTRVDADAKQKVVFPYAAMPRIPAAKWDALPPTWQEIWSAQEDLWLLSEVLNAVRETNGSTASITDSYVKQIMQVQLFGGKRAAAPDATTSTSATSAYAGMMPVMAGRGSRRGSSSAPSKPAEFAIAEEYEVAGGGGGVGAASQYMMNEENMAIGGGTSTATDPNSDESRYLQAEEAYRTRGFKLKVAIHQMQVPTLIRELLNSQYPIEIIRYQQSAMNPEEPGKPSGRSSGYPGGNSIASMRSGYSGEESDEYSDDANGGGAESYLSSEDPFGFDGEGEGEGSGTGALSGQAYSVPAIANVQASLEDRDLVELVIIGEIYIYNPPAVDESAAGAEPPDQVVSAATSPATVEETPVEGVEGPAVPADATAVQPAAPVDAGVSAAQPAPSADRDNEKVPAATLPANEPASEAAPVDGAPADVTTDGPPPDSNPAVAQPASGDATPPASNDSQTP
jgi:hypothetical protein